MTPDPRQDVMVYQVAMIDALSGVSIGDRWTVWLGTESEGSFESEAEAISIVTELADDHKRPAWLIKGGGETIAI
jgi:hypothetical protein